MLILKKTYLTLQYSSSTVQQLAHGGWHWVNRQEDFSKSEREEMGELKKRQHRDGGEAAVSLTPDVDGTSFGSLLGSILSTILKKMIQ